MTIATIEWRGIYQKNAQSTVCAIFITKQPDKGRRGGGGGGYSLRYMKHQQGLSVDFSLFGFCELFVKMGIDFKYFDL